MIVLVALINQVFTRKYFGARETGVTANPLVGDPIDQLKRTRFLGFVFQCVSFGLIFGSYLCRSQLSSLFGWSSVWAL